MLERGWIAEWGIWLGNGHRVYICRNQRAKAFEDRGRWVGRVKVGVGGIPLPGLQVESERGNGGWTRRRMWTTQLEKSCSQQQASTRRACQGFKWDHHVPAFSSTGYSCWGQCRGEGEFNLPWGLPEFCRGMEMHGGPRYTREPLYL